MKITFLGTGTSIGVPMIGCSCAICQSADPKDRRLRTSILIETAEQTIVIDTTPDFREQMLRTKTQQIDAVLYTHQHRDHTAGLDEIRAFNIWQKKAIDLYATTVVQQDLRQSFPYIFVAEEDRYPGAPMVNLHTIDNTPFQIHQLPIIPIEATHGWIKVLGFRFGDFTYLTDAKTITAKEKKKLYNSKVLVLNALQKTPEHWSHFTLSEAISLAKEVNAEQVYFTHISHRMGFHEKVEQELPDHMHLAYDQLEIEV